MDPDTLFSLKSLFWIGNYRLALSEAEGINPATERLRIDKEFYMLRCYAALGEYSKIMKQVSDDSPTDLLAVKLFATYMQKPDQKQSVLATLKELLGDPNSGGNSALRLIAGNIFLNDGDVKEALKAVRSEANLEMIALAAQIYLKMHRVALAEAQLKKMQQNDEDSTLTHLVSAWVNLAKGGDKYQEAAYTYQELIDKNGPSAILLNGLAVCNIKLKRFDEALRLVQKGIKSEGEWDALPQTAIVADLLVNLLVCAVHMRKQNLAEECLDRLSKIAPVNHPFSASLQTLKAVMSK